MQVMGVFFFFLFKEKMGAWDLCKVVRGVKERISLAKVASSVLMLAGSVGRCG